MDENKLASAIAEGISRGNAHMGEKFLELAKLQMASKDTCQYGFMVLITSSELSSLMRDRAKELRAEVKQVQEILGETTKEDLERLRSIGRRAGAIRAFPEQAQLQEHFDSIERDARRLEFLAEHVILGDYKISPSELSSVLLEHHMALAALKGTYSV